VARWPTSAFTIAGTRGYGAVRRSAADGGCGIGSYPCTHYGMDLVPKDKDSRVYAPEGGTVVDIAYDTAPYAGYGPSSVNMLGDSGVYHLLAHLDPSTLTVTPGMRVMEGMHLARFDAAHAHTHYEVRKAKTGPNATNTVNPELWMAGQGLFGGLGSLLLFGAVAWISYKLIKGETLL
jgi:murein DD-endopeptidase MepM/ murein hydrolase activator NlpD